MESTEKQETHNDTAKVIGALLVGAAIGAGLGILFSKGEGAETIRKKIKDELNDLAEGVKDKITSHHCPGCNCKKEEQASKQS